LGGRGGDPDGRLPFPEDCKLRELPGQVLEGGLVLLVLKGEPEGLDVLRVHFVTILTSSTGAGMYGFWEGRGLWPEVSFVNIGNIQEFQFRIRIPSFRFTSSLMSKQWQVGQR
jgi:hypothetical protein